VHVVWVVSIGCSGFVEGQSSTSCNATGFPFDPGFQLGAEKFEKSSPPQSQLIHKKFQQPTFNDLTMATEKKFTRRNRSVNYRENLGLHINELIPGKLNQELKVVHCIKGGQTQGVQGLVLTHLGGEPLFDKKGSFTFEVMKDRIKALKKKKRDYLATFHETGWIKHHNLQMADKQKKEKQKEKNKKAKAAAQKKNKKRRRKNKNKQPPKPLKRCLPPRNKPR